MKKRVWIICFACLLLLSGGYSSNTHAYAYPQNLNGDPNYVLTYGHMNYGTYIDTSSVKVIANRPDGIVFSVKTVSGLVLGKGDDWIVPARQIRHGEMMFMRLYNDSWEVIYYYDYRTNTWKQGDLSNHFGYNLPLVGAFRESWKVLTGSPYPNL